MNHALGAASELLQRVHALVAAAAGIAGLLAGLDAWVAAILGAAVLVVAFTLRARDARPNMAEQAPAEPLRSAQPPGPPPVAGPASEDISAARGEYSIEDWEEEFSIDPDDHSLHTYVIRLRIKAKSDVLPGFCWFTHYTGGGEKTRPATAGPPVVEGADFVGYVAADQRQPGWTGWRLRFKRALRAGEEVDVAIVQTLHDAEGHFEPVFNVDAPVEARRLVLRLRVPDDAVPTRYHGFVGGGRYPSEVAAWPVELRPVDGEPLMELVMKIAQPMARCAYWMTWGDPATGTKSPYAVQGRDRKRTDLAFTRLAVARR